MVWPKRVLNKNSFSFASNSKSNLLTSAALSGNKMKPSQVRVWLCVARHPSALAVKVKNQVSKNTKAFWFREETAIY